MNTEPTQVLVLGVTGSIAAYKAADLTSKLSQAGIPVQVIMTENARKLVCAQTFFTLSQRPVLTDLWTLPDWKPGHIDLADRSALLLIAPATANILAKLAFGGPMILAPAMNCRMWEKPAVERNVRQLREDGFTVIDPEEGYLSCRARGPGRMASPERIFQAIADVLNQTK